MTSQSYRPKHKRQPQTKRSGGDLLAKIHQGNGKNFSPIEKFGSMSNVTHYPSGEKPQKKPVHKKVDSRLVRIAKTMARGAAVYVGASLAAAAVGAATLAVTGGNPIAAVATTAPTFAWAAGRLSRAFAKDKEVTAYKNGQRAGMKNPKIAKHKTLRQIISQAAADMKLGAKVLIGGHIGHLAGAGVGLVASGFNPAGAVVGAAVGGSLMTGYLAKHLGKEIKNR